MCGLWGRLPAWDKPGGQTRGGAGAVWAGPPPTPPDPARPGRTGRPGRPGLADESGPAGRLQQRTIRACLRRAVGPGNLDAGRLGPQARGAATVPCRPQAGPLRTGGRCGWTAAAPFRGPDAPVNGDVRCAGRPTSATRCDCPPSLSVSLSPVLRLSPSLTRCVCPPSLSVSHPLWLSSVSLRLSLLSPVSLRLSLSPVLRLSPSLTRCGCPPSLSVSLSLLSSVSLRLSPAVAVLRLSPSLSLSLLSPVSLRLSPAVAVLRLSPEHNQQSCRA
jgi:hypothetical protein